MSAERTFVRSWKVGRYTATLTAPRPKRGEVRCAVIEWEPCVPSGLPPDDLAAYRAGRDAAMADMAAEFQIRVGVVDQ